MSLKAQKRRISIALDEMARGLALYHKGQERLNLICGDICDGNISDIVNDDVDRQDALLSITEGISASAEDILDWCEEFKHKETDHD